jgi:hypothetical protein
MLACALKSAFGETDDLSVIDNAEDPGLLHLGSQTL